MINDEYNIPEELSKLQEHMVFLANNVYSELAHFICNNDNDGFDDKCGDADEDADHKLFSKLANVFRTFYRSLNLDSNKSCVEFIKGDEETLKYLGFKKWDDEPNKDRLYLWLIPFWLFPMIPDGTELYTISGKSFIWDSENPADLESRFGCLGYGILKDF